MIAYIVMSLCGRTGESRVLYDSFNRPTTVALFRFFFIFLCRCCRDADRSSSSRCSVECLISENQINSLVAIQERLY
jgi:hypothetical protein